MTTTLPRRALLALGLTMLPAALPAQSPALDRDYPSAAWLAVMRPDLKDRFGSSYTGLLIDLGLRWRFSDGITLVAEVPYATANTNALGFGRQSVIGNIYVGALFSPRSERFQLELGARPPIVQDDPNTGGARTNASFGEASVHQLSAGATWRGGRVRPTLFLRLPLDRDLRDELSSVLGLGLVVALR